MSTVLDLNDNEKDTVKRVTDNSVKWFIIKYGPWAALAFYMVYRMAGGIDSGITAARGDVNTMRTELNSHISEQRFYLGAICYMTAKQTGESPQICQPGLPAQMPTPNGR